MNKIQIQFLPYYLCWFWQECLYLKLDAYAPIDTLSKYIDNFFQLKTCLYSLYRIDISLLKNICWSLNLWSLFMVFLILEAEYLTLVKHDTVWNHMIPSRKKKILKFYLKHFAFLFDWVSSSESKELFALQWFLVVIVLLFPILFTIRFFSRACNLFFGLIVTVYSSWRPNNTSFAISSINWNFHSFYIEHF